MKHVATFSLALFVPIAAAAAELPAGYWGSVKTQPILAKTETIRLDPSLDGLSEAERVTVIELIRVGEIMQKLYEESRHDQARTALTELQKLHASGIDKTATQNLLDLYRLNQGPIATTLDNKREPFLPVDAPTPGRNVYPKGITKQELEEFLTANPGARESILAERTIVRRTTKENVIRDLQMLQRHRVLATLHLEFKLFLEQLSRNPALAKLYAVPYAVAYGDEYVRAHEILTHAATTIEHDDAEFARYLRNRARDLLSNDYESGDASWVTGNFKNLNAQIGAYETYDDALYGAKAFHSLSLLRLDAPATAELRKALGGLQEIENQLPYENRKRVREQIPVGIYDVLADFGQARGTNTATILPNDFLFSRRYGRTILMRRNIMTDQAIFGASQKGWQAVVAPSLAQHLQPEGNFYRTLWHEVGHYLGADADKQGRPLDIALEDYADSLEEMKADLVSLFALHKMHATGGVSAERLQAVRASGIRRTLQNNKPRKDQPYQMMQLAQFNYFLEKGLLSFDPKSQRLSADYSKYESVVTDLLREVLAIQYGGDKSAAEKFFDRWGAWDPKLHDAVAAKLRGAEGARFRIVKYAALQE